MIKGKDFTIETYCRLLEALKAFGFEFFTYREFVERGATEEKMIILRHDVDARKENSLQFARLQHHYHVVGTYYFRIVPASYDEKVIRQIAELGHEIGYHYETMDTSKGNIDDAYSEFCFHLEKLRKIVPVTTICMHGSPLSKFDNRQIWAKYDYKKLGLVAEPYFETDFNKIFYLTDTGRRWDGSSVSVRDKVSVELTNSDFKRRRYKSTFEIISNLNSYDFPSQVMMTFHPQRWTDNSFHWWSELFIQNVKNQVKRLLVS